MSKTTRQQNMRKMDSAINHIEKAIEAIEFVGQQYVNHAPIHSYNMAVIVQALQLSRNLLEDKDPRAIPAVEQTLQIALAITQDEKWLT